MKGKVMENGKPQKWMQYFCYTHAADIALLAVIGNAGNANILIDAGSDFIAKYMTVHVTQAGLVVANWGGTIQVNDTAHGRTFYSNAIPVSAVAGNGQLPYPFDPPRLCQRNTTLEITVTNNVATATNVRVVLHGNKVYDVEPV